MKSMTCIQEVYQNMMGRMKAVGYLFFSLLSALAFVCCGGSGSRVTDAGLDAGSDAGDAFDGGDTERGDAYGGDADGGDASDAGADGTQNELVKFQRHPSNPLYQSSASAWNFAGIGDPCVVFDSDSGTYKMLTSAGGVVPPKSDVIVRTQSLSSADGIGWTEHEGVVLMEGADAGDWDRGGVETVSVLKDGGKYWLWYAGYAQRESPPVTMKIGLATSSDGMTWQKAAENPVVGKGSPGDWDESWVESPTVVKVGEKFFMWYTGVDSEMHFRIGLATSDDGILWTKALENPVFAPESSNEWENGAVYAPSVVWDEDQFVMFYVGLNAVTFLDAMRIGMATSTDGISWSRAQSEPVLDIGAPGAWDEGGPFVPSVLVLDHTYMMWYLSGTNPDEKIGLASWHHQ